MTTAVPCVNANTRLLTDPEVRGNPGQDILSDLVNAVDSDGERLTETELLATSRLVLAAGFETTVNLIGNGIVLPRQHPEQRALLAEQPALWPNAVDEMLRYAVCDT